MKIRFFILFNLVLFWNFALPQNIYFEGNVIDAFTEKPIANVNIKVLNKNIGTLTNSKGYFKLISKDKIIKLQFTHISYNKKVVIFNGNNVLSDSSVVIKMTPKAYTLPEIDINDKKFETVYSNNEKSILDYEIYHNRIFLIVKDYSDFSIKLFNIDINLNDTILIKTPDIPKRFFVNIYENINVISKNDSAYQMVISGNKTIFYKPIPFDTLSYQNNLYKFKIDDKYFFSEFENNLMDKLKFGYITKDNNTKYFYTIYDEDKINYYYLELIFLGIIPHTPPDKRRAIVTKNYNNPSLYFDRKFMYNNIKVLFFKLKDKIYIIDNVNYKLAKFDKNGNKLYEISLNFSHKDSLRVNALLEQKGGHIWRKQVIINNDDSTKVFLPVRIGIKTNLFALNLNSGRLEYVKTFPHIFPKKIMIADGKIYYLYQKPGTLRNYGLYRTELY